MRSSGGTSREEGNREFAYQGAGRGQEIAGQRGLKLSEGGLGSGRGIREEGEQGCFELGVQMRAGQLRVAW